MVRARGFGFAGDGLVPQLNQSAWYSLDLKEDDLKDIFRELEDALQEAADFMLSDE